MITRQMRSQLENDLGFTPSQIGLMTPARASALLLTSTSASEVAEAASEFACGGNTDTLSTLDETAQSQWELVGMEVAVLRRQLGEQSDLSER